MASFRASSCRNAERSEEEEVSVCDRIPRGTCPGALAAAKASAYPACSQPGGCWIIEGCVCGIEPPSERTKWGPFARATSADDGGAAVFPLVASEGGRAAGPIRRRDDSQCVRTPTSGRSVIACYVTFCVCAQQSPGDVPDTATTRGGKCGRQIFIAVASAFFELAP